MTFREGLVIQYNYRTITPLMSLRHLKKMADDLAKQWQNKTKILVLAGLGLALI